MLCTQFTPFKTNFIILYPIYSFQDPLTLFYYCVPNWILSKPYNVIFVLSNQLTPFKTIWPIFIIVSLFNQLTPCKTIWPNFVIVYPIDSFQDPLTHFYYKYRIESFQDHIMWFLYCLTNWLLSRPFDLFLSLFNQLTPCMTIWPNFIIVYPIDSFQDYLTQFYHCVPNWILSRQFHLLLSNGVERSQLGTQW